MSVHIFGIRHHGVGSCRSLLAALETLQPDCILIEGPPDADALIPLVAHADMQPPVALLVYDPDQPQRAAWYPFAVYSPEWQAIRYGLATEAAVRFMDLPQKYSLGLQQVVDDTPLESESSAPPEGAAPDDSKINDDSVPPNLYFDPLGALATAAGETDGESWWGRVVEESSNPIEIFEAIHEAMASLRQEHPVKDGFLQYQENLREAWMRTTIRAAEKQYQRIAVVCGAWHTPALADRKSTKAADSTLLKGLVSVKTMATFAPWTYSRLTAASGYGAGILSPGWYHHLWETDTTEVAARWLGRVATLLREEGMLASTAQVIDGVRLSQMLATIRGRNVGLDELNEASVSVLCAGHTEPLQLIRTRLIVSDRLGRVPEETPSVPLQRDLQLQQKRLRFGFAEYAVTLDLDLRQPTDLKRSQLFHRLNLLNIPGATSTHATVKSTGTFHEFWSLEWTPELDIKVIEASVWGNTVESAAVAFAQHIASEAQRLSEVTTLLQKAILSDLPQAVEAAIHRLYALASVTHDVAQLIEATPPLVETLRYGDVRKTDSGLIAPVLESMVIRACIGLYPASLHLDDDAAHDFYARMMAFNSALQLGQDSLLLVRWHEALSFLPPADAVHPLVAGAATRLLFRAEQATATDVATWMRRAFSIGHEAAYGANWLEGFLSGMEQTLLRDDTLFTLVDTWVVGLPLEQFEDILPLLRRTFSSFDSPARRNLAERVTKGERTVKVEVIDEARAARVLPLLHQLLGLGS